MIKCYHIHHDNVSMITKEAREKMGWRKGLLFTAYKKNCEICNKQFKTVPTSKKQFTCSRDCWTKRRIKKRVKYNCLMCGKDIYDLKKKKGGRKYCNTKCKIDAYALLKRKRFENKRIFGKWRGYRELKKYLLEKYNSCVICGWKENINILEIHHKNRNRLDNSENNISLICPNCHTLDHFNNNDGQFKNNKGKKYATHESGKENN